MERLYLSILQVPHIAARHVKLFIRGVQDAAGKRKISKMAALQLELDHDYVISGRIEL